MTICHMYFQMFDYEYCIFKSIGTTISQTFKYSMSNRCTAEVQVFSFSNSKVQHEN